MIVVYLKTAGRNYLIALLPGTFYTFIVFSYIFHEKIGFGLEARIGEMFGIADTSYAISYTLGAICAVLFLWLVPKLASKRKDIILNYKM